MLIIKTNNFQGDLTDITTNGNTNAETLNQDELVGVNPRGNALSESEYATKHMQFVYVL